MVDKNQENISKESEETVPNEENTTKNETSNESVSTESADENSMVTTLQNEVNELKDKYLRQVAEFDNFRRRTAKERIELIQTASKDLVTELLEVLDDYERAEKQMANSTDVVAIKEGTNLIFSKLRNILQAKGLKPMNATGEEFNADLHEAITEIPAPTEELKGKVIDEVVKGYYLNEKIIRYAKVVVGK